MNKQMNGHATQFLLAVFAILLQIAKSFAQVGPCDPDILRLSNSSVLAYKDLGERCEGTFANPSGGTADLQLVSLTQSFPLINFKDTPSLSLSWLAPSPRDVRLRALSTRYKYYYQMDAHPGVANNFAWSTDRLVASGLRRPEVGLLAWTAHIVAKETQELLLPVVVQANGPQLSQSQSIEVVLFPTVQLKEIFRTITNFTDAEVEQSVLLNNLPLQYGSYQAHERIPLPLDLGTASGLFRLDVIATISEGGTVGRSYWIYDGRTH